MMAQQRVRQVRDRSAARTPPPTPSSSSTRARPTSACRARATSRCPRSSRTWTSAAKWDQIQGITFHKDGQASARRAGALSSDMDELPFPAYHLYDMPALHAADGQPGRDDDHRRGCPYACTFCDAEMTPRQYRAMSPERTVDLIEMLVQRYNPPQMILLRRPVHDPAQARDRDLQGDRAPRPVLRVELRVARRHDGLRDAALDAQGRLHQDLLRARIGLAEHARDDEEGRDAREDPRGRASSTREIGMYFKFFILYGFPEDAARTTARPRTSCAAARPRRDLLLAPRCRSRAPRSTRRSSRS